MTRIFSSLAVLAMAALAANLLVGLSIGNFTETAEQMREAQREIDRRQLIGVPQGDPDLQAARQRAAQLSNDVRPKQQRAAFHKLVGIAATLIAMLVNSVAITYFVGTSRWCKEVSDAYQLDLGRVELGRRLKTRTFGSAIVAMLTVIVLAGLGAAADPGNSASGGQTWVEWHRYVAYVGLVVVGVAFWYQAEQLRANYAIIQAIMNDVRRIREQHT